MLWQPRWRTRSPATCRMRSITKACIRPSYAALDTLTGSRELSLHSLTAHLSGIAAMAKVEHLQTNFTAGEVSPRMYSRVDFARYANSVKSMRNCHGIVTGGAIRRPGTRHLGGLGTSATNIRLVPFQWQDNGYVLVFVSGTSSVQVFKITPTAATLLTTIAVSIADPQSMRISQNGRALYITTGNEFKTITYQNDFAWDVSDFGFYIPPLTEDARPTGTSATLSALTGSITITIVAGEAPFVPADVGRQITTLSSGGLATITAYTSATQVTAQVVAAFPFTNPSDSILEEAVRSFETPRLPFVSLGLAIMESMSAATQFYGSPHWIWKSLLICFYKYWLHCCFLNRGNYEKRVQRHTMWNTFCFLAFDELFCTVFGLPVVKRINLEDVLPDDMNTIIDFRKLLPGRSNVMFLPILAVGNYIVSKLRDGVGSVLRPPIPEKTSALSMDKNSSAKSQASRAKLDVTVTPIS